MKTNCEMRDGEMCVDVSGKTLRAVRRVDPRIFDGSTLLRSVNLFAGKSTNFIISAAVTIRPTSSGTLRSRPLSTK